MGGSDETVWFDGVVTRVRDSSFTIEVDGESKVIPFSQRHPLSDTIEDGMPATVGVPSWLAEDREIEGREER